MAESNNIQLNNPSSASFSAQEMLSYLDQNGIIDVGSVETQMRAARRKKLLDSHPYLISQGKDGRWRTYIKDPKQPHGRKMIVKSSREKVEDFICEYYASLDENDSRKKVTMASLFEEWIEYKSLHVERTTIERVRRDWNRYYANENIIHIPLVKLTKLDIDVWVHEMIRKYSMTKHSFGNFRLIIRQELDYAVDREIIDKNPFLSVKIDQRRVLTPEHKKPDHTQVYSKEELDKLVEVAWKDFNEKEHPVHQLAPLAVMFMFLTGVRVGEVCGIRYEDIYGKTMMVRRMVRHPGGEIVEHTKGYDDREVPLVPQALRLIEIAKERQEEAGASTEGFVFSMNDDPILYTSVTKAFTAYCKQIGIEVKSSHKARKTFVSTLLDADININSVRQFVGHKDEKTTLNNYCYDRSSDEERYKKMELALA